MLKSRSFESIALSITICLFLIAGSISMISFTGYHTNNEKVMLTDPMNESVITENVQQAMRAHFYENLGQVQNGEVRFYGELPGLGVGFTADGVIYRLTSQKQDTNKIDGLDIQERESVTESLFVTLSFEGANVVTPQGHMSLTYKSNYFIGDNPDQWFTGIRSFNEILYPNLYDNIDLIYRSSEEGLKYEFIVWPGGDPNDIKLQYDGIEGLSVDEDGSLVAVTSLGPMVDRGLFIYQDTQSCRKEIAGNFITIADNDCGFGFHISADYNEDLPLIIDPFLHYSTFVGSNLAERGYSIALDRSNNAYVSGYTASSSFPTTPEANDTSHNGNLDVFILKLSADGSTILYSTFIGGTLNDCSQSIALDSLNNAYVTGYTYGSGFPTTSGANDTIHNGNGDVFILKLSADGSTILYSTFVGGASDEYGYSIALDTSNNAYVAGYTQGNGFPTTSEANDTSHNGGDDVFILKLNADGSTLLYSTYVGGGSSDVGWSIALDTSNNAYVTGDTSSTDFPTTPGANDTTHNSGGSDDVFILKLSADGSTLLYSTFVGGSSYERGYSIALDSSNNAYVTGSTFSSNFPTTPRANDTSHNEGYDVFILKLSADGSTLLYSTFVGGSSDDRSESIVLDSSNNAYVTGYTYGSGYPTTSGANDTSHNGGQDVFILKLSADGSNLLYSTFVGGGSSDIGWSIALDASNNAYIAGSTSSSGFPTTSEANDTSYNSGGDVFILKIDTNYVDITIENPISITYSVDSISVNYTIQSVVDYSVTILLDGVSNVTAFPSGSQYTELSHGDHNITIVATNMENNLYKSTIIFRNDIMGPDVNSPSDIFYTVNAIGNYIHWTIGDWFPGQYLIEGNGSTVGLTVWSENSTISFNIDGLTVGFAYNHTITVYDIFGNSATDTVFVKVLERADLNSPLDAVIELGTTGHYLRWTIGSVWWPLPSYRIDGNATTIDWTECVDRSISISIDGLDVGVWNFTITVMDQFSYITSDTIIVTVVDTISPEIDSPLGVVYDETTTGNSLTWTPYDLRPESYEIFRNGSSIESGTWDGTSITINVDGLSVGIYNYTLTVFDSSGNNAFCTVMVVVLAASSTTTTTTGTTTSTTPTITTLPPIDYTIIILVAIGAGVCIVIVVILLSIRKRSSK